MILTQIGDLLRADFLTYERAEGCSRGFRSANRFSIDRRADRGRNNRSLQDKEIPGTHDSAYPPDCPSIISMLAWWSWYQR